MVRVGVLGAAVALSVVAAGCSSDGDAASGPTKVQVGLKEWSFAPDRTEAPAGKITFQVENSGKEVHELVLFESDLAPADFPRDEDGAVDERGAGVKLVDEVEDVKPGETKSFTVDVGKGKYVMACNIVENGQVHYDHKMYHSFTVN
jgi:uncharacterized cupredoxin-like copper-binding protein